MIYPFIRVYIHEFLHLMGYFLPLFQHILQGVVADDTSKSGIC
jgi:hypothetical protein